MTAQKIEKSLYTFKTPLEIKSKKFTSINGDINGGKYYEDIANLEDYIITALSEDTQKRANKLSVDMLKFQEEKQQKNKLVSEKPKTEKEKKDEDEALYLRVITAMGGRVELSNKILPIIQAHYSIDTDPITDHLKSLGNDDRFGLCKEFFLKVLKKNILEMLGM